MSDYYCDDCGERLEFRILPDGSEATVCQSCNPWFYEYSTVDPSEVEEYKHLFRAGLVRQNAVYAFKCGNCGAGGSDIEKFTEKTNTCHSCGWSYPVR